MCVNFIANKHQQSDFMLHVLCRMQHSSAYAYVFLSQLTWLSLQLRVAAFVSRSMACLCVYKRCFRKVFFNVETIITMSERIL